MNNSKYQYNSYPLGKLPKELQRQEPEKIKEYGYDWNDPRDIIDIFEKKICSFAGCKYSILVDCCSHGIFLSIKYLQSIGELSSTDNLIIPKRTYASVPMQISHAGLNYSFEDLEWSGLYQLKNSRVWDSAVRWTKNMYIGNNSLQVISFQIKKRIPIGRGGVILTDDENAAKWLKLASYDGRNLLTPYTDPTHISIKGYHMYMTPEDAARGIILMDSMPEINNDSGTHLNYTDLSEIESLRK
jgi:dTDP-4-amino-4,6-dideoxygalactose transaminase